MSDFGSFPDPRSVRFERLLPGPIERVWEFLTMPAGLATWLGKGEIEPRLGGRIAFPGDPEKGGAPIWGVVTRWEPPRALAYTWIVPIPTKDGGTVPSPESIVTFELEPQGERVRLTLTHRPILDGYQPQTGGGWHVLLDALAAGIAGTKPDPFMTAFARVLPHYVRIASAPAGRTES